jgi:hypothetical protein
MPTVNIPHPAPWRETPLLSRLDVMHVIMIVTIKLIQALEVLERLARLEAVYSAKSNLNRLIKSSS